MAVFDQPRSASISGLQ